MTIVRERHPLMEESIIHPKYATTYPAMTVAIDCPSNFSDSDALVALARVMLMRHLDSSTQPIDPTNLICFPPFSRVNVTLRRDGYLRGSMPGYGASIMEQVIDAAFRVARDDRFGAPLTAEELPHITIEVWLQTAREAIPVARRTEPGILLLGVHGVEIEYGDAIAFYKPSVALLTNIRSTTELFAKVCLKAGLDAQGWRSADCILRRTSWIHCCETQPGRGVRMVALRKADPCNPTFDEMFEWITRGADHLCTNQEPAGHYRYSYNPILESQVSAMAELATGRPAHMVRAAGCVYSMAIAASVARQDAERDRYRDSATRAIAALQAHAIDLDGDIFLGEQQKGEAPWGKLGTVALLAAAVSLPALRDRHADLRARLLDTIVAAQRPDGTFRCRLGHCAEGSRDQEYYPGQALLALAMNLPVDPGATLERCRRALNPYRAHFQARPDGAFVLWQVDAWARLAAATGDKAMVEFVFDLVDWALECLLRYDERSIMRGSGSTGPAICVIAEAIVRAATLARTIGDLTRWADYRLAARRAVRSCARLLIGPEQRPFLREPIRAYGGVTRSLETFEVRCDYVQHLITLAAAAVEDRSLFESSGAYPHGVSDFSDATSHIYKQ